MAPHFGRGGNDRKQEWGLRPEDYDWDILLGKEDKLSIQQMSKHPVTPSWLSAPGLCTSLLTQKENHTFLHSSLNSRIVFPYFAFKTVLKGKVLPQGRYQAQAISVPKMTVLYIYKQLKSRGLFFAPVTIGTETSTCINRGLGFHSA